MATNGRAQLPTPSKPERWRLFAAVPLTDDVRDLLADIQRQLAPRDWPLRWVDPALAHITTQFYGDVDAGDAPRLEGRLGEIAAGQQPAALATGALGAFPSQRRPRVVWLGLSGAVERLDALAAAVATTAELAPQADVKSFRPHITLGRLRGGAITDFDAAVAELRLPSIALPLDRLQLIRSVISRNGPTYTTLAEWRLGAPTKRPELREHG